LKGTSLNIYILDSKTVQTVWGTNIYDFKAIISGVWHLDVQFSVFRRFFSW